MKITLLTIGKCRDKNILTLCSEYIKRLKPHWPTHIVELSDRSGDKTAEAALIHHYLEKQKNYTLIALDERGKEHSSKSFAQALQHLQEIHTTNLIFLIGGANGIEESIKKKGQLFSLSKLTLPHMLVRPLILEQIYRSATILTGHPYHRE